MTQKTDTIPTPADQAEQLSRSLEDDRELLDLFQTETPLQQELIDELTTEIEEKEVMLNGFYRLLGEAKGEAVVDGTSQVSGIESTESATSDGDEVHSKVRKSSDHGISGPISPRDLQARLEKGGFQLVPGRGKGSHVIFRNDEGVSFPVPVHGDIGKGLAVSILRQAGLIDRG